MGRPFGAKNRGFRYALMRQEKELHLMSKSTGINVSDLVATAAAFKRLLGKAIRMASPNDAGNLQRLGASLSALSKTLQLINKMQEEEHVPRIINTMRPLD